jgi:(p)ppGpp synthase/HD superfamily hydrolase
VEWQQGKEGRHTATLRLDCSNQIGILADLGAVCKTLGLNINHLETEVLSDQTAQILLSISILHIDQINKLRKNLMKIKGVDEVTRI